MMTSTSRIIAGGAPERPSRTRWRIAAKCAAGGTFDETESLRISRRHLDESQRAMVAAALANMTQGERTDLPSIEGRSISQETAAKMLNVGLATVERAKAVLRSGIPDLADLVRSGEACQSRHEPTPSRKGARRVACDRGT